MATPPNDLVRAWLEAAEDLGVAVISPYAIGEQVFVAHIGEFGSPKGTVVDWQASGNATAGITSEGYHVSVVSPQSYRVYDGDLFRETLDDWGWHGDPEHQPEWYAGRPWTE